jgi:hypothetical protein
MLKKFVWLALFYRQVLGLVKMPNAEILNYKGIKVQNVRQKKQISQNFMWKRQ